MPTVSKSISRLIDKLNNNLIDEEEEEVPAKPAMPRRQSLGGINVRDLAAKHERNGYFTAGSSTVQSAPKATPGHVKPLLMQEITIPTIQEEEEEEKRRSTVAPPEQEVQQEVKQEPQQEVKQEPQQEAKQDDISLRDSVAMMMDELDIDLNDLEQELGLLDIPSVVSSQPTMIEHSSVNNSSELDTMKIASVPENATIPPIPTTAPPPAPAKPLQGAGAIDDVDFESIGELDIDTMIEEMNREVEEKNRSVEKQQRDSLGQVGYSFTLSREFMRLYLL